ncbi:MAG TPA: S41 family peptidase [Terriglobales bacterium]|nr:S41 family peptidase [Terriglobales bacterium]
MSKTSKAVLLVFSVALVIFTVVGGLRVSAATDDGAYRQLGVFSEVLSRIRTEYVEEPNIPQVTDGALHGLLESLDANSSYLTPAEYKEVKAHSGEAKGQIGATVSKRFGYAAVVSVLPGGAAEKAGVETSDIIEAIENKSTREMSLAEVQNLLSGPVGSNVTVSIVRARRAEPLKLTITRDLTKYPAVDEKLLQDSIGYIKVDAFPNGKTQEIAAKIKSAQDQGAKKLILDLRDSSDGDVKEGIAAANLFLDHGTITYLQGQKYPRETFTADSKKAVTNLPLVVLVNRGTGGPAEVLAAAVLENARGDVVGDKTFGLGSVQKTIPIPDGSALILSVAKYYTPNGKAIQDNAITPNITVADNNDDFVLPDDDDDSSSNAEPEKKAKTMDNDQQLQRAIQVLKNKDGHPAEKKAA